MERREFLAAPAAALFATEARAQAAANRARSTGVDVTAFGARGDGQTDDTEAIRHALAESCSVYFPCGTYLHRGFELPENKVISGAAPELSVLKLANGTNPRSCVRIARTGSQIRSLTIDGNRKENRSGVGIDASAATSKNPTHFTFLDRVYVKNCADTGVDLRFSNMSSLLNCSITRCRVGLHIERSRPVTLMNVDIAKFIEVGIEIKGSSYATLVNYYSGFMETYVRSKNGRIEEETQTGAAFVRFKNLQPNDTITLSGLWMNGHWQNGGSDCAALVVDGGARVSNIHMDRTIMHDVALPLRIDKSPLGGLNSVSMTRLTRTGETPALERIAGLFTDSSAPFQIVSQPIDLSRPNEHILFAAPGRGPLRVFEILEIIDDGYFGNSDGTLAWHGADGIDRHLPAQAAPQSTRSLLESDSGVDFDTQGIVALKVERALDTRAVARYAVRGVAF